MQIYNGFWTFFYSHFFGDFIVLAISMTKRIEMELVSRKT